MKNYDPNAYGTHKIKITLQQWEYVGHIYLSVRGNCKGLDVLDFDFDCDIDEDNIPENDCNLVCEGDYFKAELHDSEGGVLQIDGDAYEMNKCIVAIEITDFIEE